MDKQKVYIFCHSDVQIHLIEIFYIFHKQYKFKLLIQPKKATLQTESYTLYLFYFIKLINFTMNN